MQGYVLDELNVETVTGALTQVVAGMLEEPEYTWSGKRPTFAVNGAGAPELQVSVANCRPDFDLYKGLRNPALVGLHPAGLRELWEYYAHATADATDPAGRSTVFRVSEPYERARERFRRVVIISVMLPAAEQLVGEYAELLRHGVYAPPETYRRGMNELADLLDGAVTRLVHRLVREDRAVLAMNGRAVSELTQTVIAPSRRGDEHGPCKNVNYPQKSVAVLTGLGQFGAHRLVMRDEQVNGAVRRFLGPLRSLVIFDPAEPRGEDGIHLLDENWRERVFQLHSGDSTQAHLRFCGYFSGDGCTRCLEVCPAGALANSTPDASGHWPDHLSRQAHRFWDGQLQFDFRNCVQPRSQMSDLYGDWICGRCLAVCAAEGVRNMRAL